MAKSTKKPKVSVTTTTTKKQVKKDKKAKVLIPVAKKPRKKPVSVAETTTLVTSILESLPSESQSYFDGAADRKYASTVPDPATVPDVYTRQTAEDPVPVVIDPLPVDPSITTSTTQEYVSNETAAVSPWLLGTIAAILVALALIYC
jgi:hypothetical protein